MSGHAKLAPSAAHRWIPCPGSIAFCEGYPNEDTEASIEGTRAHLMAAMILQGEGVSGADEEMLSYVRVYTNDILRRAEGKLLFTEVRVLVEPWTSEPGGFGTSDAIIFDPTTGHLEVRDLKYGFVVVEAEENPQLMLYALGAKHLLETFGYEVKTVTVAIHQPRRDHYSEWSVSLEKLNEFGHYAAARGAIALDCKKGEERYADPVACEYCPAKNECSVYQRRVEEILYNDFIEVKGVPTGVAKPIEGEVTPGELDMIEAWVKAKREWIFNQLQQGVKLKSWKLVEGRAGNRQFTDEKAVEEKLKKMRFKASEIKETSLISLTKIEKLVGKERWPELAPFVRQNPGQPQMAPITDKRPEYSTASDDEFRDVSMGAFQ